MFITYMASHMLDGDLYLVLVYLGYAWRNFVVTWENRELKVGDMKLQGGKGPLEGLISQSGVQYWLPT